MSDNEDLQPNTQLPITQLPEAVTLVETLLQDVKCVLQNIDASDNTEALLASMLTDVLEKDEAIISVRQTFLHWDGQDLPAYEQSEVTRALGLIKRGQLVAQNAQCLLKKALGIPDHEREQAEIEMQLRAMSAMHHHYQ